MEDVFSESSRLGRSDNGAQHEGATRRSRADGASAHGHRQALVQAVSPLSHPTLYFWTYSFRSSLPMPGDSGASIALSTMRNFSTVGDSPLRLPIST
jgi:hypothetical protein